MKTTHEPIGDGGPAFPGKFEVGRVVEYDEHLDQNVSRQLLVTRSGMTLRDYFAAKTLQAFIANPSTSMGGQPVTPEKFPALASICYMMADAMLAARNKPTTEKQP